MLSSTERWMPAIPWGLVSWLILILVWLTWSPFLPRIEPLEIYWGPPGGPVDAVGNLFLLAPLAVVAALVGGAGTTAAQRVRRGGLVAVVGTFAVEAGQVFLDQRFVSPSDILLNALGGAAAAWGAVRLVDRGCSPRRLAVKVTVLTTIASELFVIGSVVVARKMFVLEGWNAGYEILVGDEYGGDRSFEGMLRDAEICGGAGPERICASAGASTATRAGLTLAAQAVQSTEVRATARSAGDGQVGPARMITYSLGPDHRNATLALHRRHLVFRVRTPLTGENGVFPAFYLSDSVPANRTVEASAKFERGSVSMRVADDDGERSASYRPALLNAWLLAGFVKRIRIDELWRVELIAAFVVLCPVGMWVRRGIGARTWPAFLVAALVGTVLAVPGVAPLVTSSLRGIGLVAAGAVLLGGLWPLVPPTSEPCR